MFNKIGTEACSDYSMNKAMGRKLCNSQKYEYIKNILINVFDINSVLNVKHVCLPTMQGFELETTLEGQNNEVFFSLSLA